MRLLIGDDHEVVRRGVRSLLLEDSQFEVCGGHFVRIRVLDLVNQAPQHLCVLAGVPGVSHPARQLGASGGARADQLPAHCVAGQLSGEILTAGRSNRKQKLGAPRCQGKNPPSPNVTPTAVFSRPHLPTHDG